MAFRGRRAQSGGETWAGFVDALSALLMVLIFALSVFMIAQLFQGAALTGQDQVMSRLQNQINELTGMLSLERSNNALIREQLTQLSAELQQSAAARDDANRSLALLSQERDTLEAERSALEARVLSNERELDDARARLQLMEDDLDSTRDDTAASKDALARRSAELASLQRDIDALQQVRQNLEGEVARMLLVLEEARALEAELEHRLATREAELSRTQTTLVERDDELSETQAALAERESELGQTRITLSEREAELVQTLANLALRETELVQALANLAERDDELGETLSTLAERETALRQTLAILAERESELGLTRTTLAERETELGRTLASLQEAHGREEELAQDLASERSELERLALLLQQSREAEERTGEALATRTQELSDAGTRIDRLVASLSSARDRTRELESELSSEQERTLLTQREVADRNRQIDELTHRLGIVEGELDLAVELGGSQAQQIADLRDRLASLNSALEAAEVRAAQDLVQITSLGERLNAALAERVQDLSRYRSDFLARLHDHLGNRQGVKVEGDRFIIQSGILFSTGSAEISGAGRENLRQIADLIQELVSEIPDDVDWILRVDGHTDSKPIQTIRFPSNWELSTARATSVVRFLISLGVPEHRLMAAGLGEFQPLADGADADTMQRNRRIEFKLTDR